MRCVALCPIRCRRVDRCGDWLSARPLLGHHGVVTSRSTLEADLGCHLLTQSRPRVPATSSRNASARCFRSAMMAASCSPRNAASRVPGFVPGVAVSRHKRLIEPGRIAPSGEPAQGGPVRAMPPATSIRCSMRPMRLRFRSARRSVSFSGVLGKPYLLRTPLGRQRHRAHLDVEHGTAVPRTAPRLGSRPR